MNWKKKTLLTLLLPLKTIFMMILIPGKDLKQKLQRLGEYKNG